MGEAHRARMTESAERRSVSKTATMKAPAMEAATMKASTVLEHTAAAESAPWATSRQSKLRGNNCQECSQCSAKKDSAQTGSSHRGVLPLADSSFWALLGSKTHIRA